MYDLTVSKNHQLGGLPYTANRTISAQGIEGAAPDVPIAWAGVLTVRTDAVTGSLTMNSVDHLIATADKLDIYWTKADGTIGLTRGCTVGTVAGVVVPFTLALGADDLPIATTAIIGAVVQVVAITLTGDKIAALVAACDQAACSIVFMITTVEHLVIALQPNDVYEWLGDGTNPLAGLAITLVHMSHNDVTTVRSVRYGALMNA